MSENAIIGTGILLKAGDGAVPENFLAVAELVSLKPPALNRNEVDVSDHNSAPSTGESKINGMLRKGGITGKVNWLPTDPTHSDTAQGILADILANRKRNWRIEFPPNGLPKWTMPARVQLFDPDEITVDAPMQVSFALTVAGPITMVNA